MPRTVACAEDRIELKAYSKVLQGRFVARMEDVLALYAEPPDERRPSCVSTRRRAN